MIEPFATRTESNSEKQHSDTQRYNQYAMQTVALVVIGSQHNELKKYDALLLNSRIVTVIGV